MRKAASIDGNQPEIVTTLRKIGCSVAITSGLGDGFPDLVVGRRGRNLLVEVKDGSKIPSKRKLTPDQIEFHAAWRGTIVIVESIDEALAAASEHL
jgi:Holliday junction resolvase